MPATTRSALLTLTQAADHLGVSPRTIRRYVAAGRLTAHRVGPKLIRIRVDQLDRLIGTIPAAA